MSSFSLYLDIGNTNIKWLVRSDAINDTNKSPLSSYANNLKTDGDLTGCCGDFAALVGNIDKITDKGKITEIRVSSVLRRKEESSNLLAKIKNHWQLEPIMAKPEKIHKSGLAVAYEDPERLGVDRWLAMLALVCYDSDAWLVIDAGTALTIDLLDKANHLGGMILPSQSLIIDAFYHRTSMPKRASENEAYISMPSGARWGKNTETCLNLAAGQAVESLILSRMHNFWEDYQNGKVIFSGGGGTNFYKKFSADSPNKKELILCDPYIVCRGLAFI